MNIFLIVAVVHFLKTMMLCSKTTNFKYMFILGSVLVQDMLS